MAASPFTSNASQTIKRVNIETSRLLLRPLVTEDSSVLSAIGDDRRVADTVLSIPVPFPDRAASDWIDRGIANQQTVASWRSTGYTRTTCCVILHRVRYCARSACNPRAFYVRESRKTVLSKTLLFMRYCEASFQVFRKAIEERMK